MLTHHERVQEMQNQITEINTRLDVFLDQINNAPPDLILDEIARDLKDLIPFLSIQTNFIEVTNARNT